MTPQFLSEKISRHLSSLAPGFEGHYEHVPYLISGTTDDLLRYEVCCKFTQRLRVARWNRLPKNRGVSMENLRTFKIRRMY